MKRKEQALPQIRDPDLSPEYLMKEEAASYLCCTCRKISLFRQHQMLKYAKFGRHYVYKKTWLDDFAEEWAGYDLSNEYEIIRSIHEKERKKRLGYE